MLKKLIIFTSITVFCLFSLLLYCTIPKKGHCEVDSSEYIEIAQNYALSGNLVNPDHPHVMPSHSIGYHWFLGIIFTLFHHTKYIFLLQILLCILCSTLLYTLASVLFNQMTANAVALLFSCNIGFLVYAQLVLAEILFVTFLIGFITFFCHYILQRTTQYLMVSGLLLGCSIIIKPVALFYGIPLAGLVFIFAKQRKIMLSALLLCSFYMPVISYMYYNKIVFNQFCVTNLVNENLFIYFLPRRILPQLEPNKQEIYLNQIAQQRSFEHKLSISKEIFFSIAQERPWIICYAWANAMLRTFLGLYSTQLKSIYNSTIQGGSCSFFRMEGTLLNRIKSYLSFGSLSPYLTLIALWETLWLLIEYLLSIIVLLYLFNQKKYELLLFFCSYISYFSFVTGHDGCGRYRLMFEPILLLLTAFGITLCYAYFVKQQKNIIQEDLQFST